jgi:tRNA pseudouridine55 synthase
MNGVYIIDKQSGITSHDVVDSLRKVLGTKAIGHGGTLDPLATGLLVCLVGEATKLSQYVMAEEKTYQVGIRLGVRTDSGDITGHILETKDASGISEDIIIRELEGLKGPLDLKVPKFSAVKVKGKKLYEYARNNEDIDLPTKTMVIHEIKFLELTEGLVQLEIRCEKGTYVRSWVEELGQRLGVGATVNSLRRLKSGCFSIEQACLIEALKNKDDQSRFFILLELVFGEWPALKVMGAEQSLVSNGQIPKGVFSQIIHCKFESGIRVLNETGGLLALVVRDEQKGIKLARVFNKLTATPSSS